MSRGQANLPALAIALLVLTTVAVLAVTIADASMRSAERNAADRAVATATADRLVAADSTATVRGNVLNGSLDADSVAASLPPDVDARVALDGEAVYERGDPTGGETARRIVLVADQQAVEVEPPFEFRSVTLPRRSPRATLDIEPSADIETVRANDRVVLYEPGGLDGTYEVPLSRYETTTLRVDGFPDDGEVTVTYYPRQTQKALLEVTVSA